MLLGSLTMIRNLLVALALLAAGTAEAKVLTLPLEGTARLTATDEPLAEIGGSVSFDAGALVTDPAFTPVEALTLDINVVDVAGLTPGRYIVDETDRRFDDTPQVWRFGERYELELQATESFAGMDHRIVASAFDSGLAVFDEGFTTVVEGDLEVVPLPGALPLLASAVAALAWLRHRRGRS